MRQEIRRYRIYVGVTRICRRHPHQRMHTWESVGDHVGHEQIPQAIRRRHQPDRPVVGVDDEHVVNVGVDERRNEVLEVRRVADGDSTHVVRANRVGVVLLVVR